MYICTYNVITFIILTLMISITSITIRRNDEYNIKNKINYRVALTLILLHKIEPCILRGLPASICEPSHLLVLS